VVVGTELLRGAWRKLNFLLAARKNETTGHTEKEKGSNIHFAFNLSLKLSFPVDFSLNSSSISTSFLFLLRFFLIYEAW
jgi:hypothetical protein